ncbi:GAF domain-containing protein [bacterium]|nr:GAF domain-containing protein [bacterium]
MPFEEPVRKILNLARGQTTLRGLERVLQKIAEDLDTYGCVLWVQPPQAPDNPTSKSFGRMMAKYFRGGESIRLYEIHDANSPSQECLDTGNFVPPNAPFGRRVCRLLDGKHLEWSWAAPVLFSGNVRGALTVYSDIPKPDFLHDHVSRLKLYADMIPELQQGIEDRVGLELLARINKIISDGIRAEQGALIDEDTRNEVLQQVCEAISDVFDCIETSVFFRTSTLPHQRFEQCASTWPTKSDPEKTTYILGDGEEISGITEWVLRAGEPRLIPDLLRLPDRIAGQEKDQAVRWGDSLGIAERIRDIFKLQDHEATPPLSWMGVPVPSEQSSGPREDDQIPVVGIIRCCCSKSGPYYFTEENMKLLGLVAARISSFWGLSHRQIQVIQENILWKNSIRKVIELNAEIDRRTAEGEYEITTFYQEAVDLVYQSIPQARAVCIELLDHERSATYFVAAVGDEELSARIKKRMAGMHPFIEESATGKIIRDRIPLALQATEPDKWKLYKGTLPGIYGWIGTPILIEGEKRALGVLAVSLREAGLLPSDNVHLLQLLAAQLGLYTRVAERSAESAATKGELRRQIEFFDHISKLHRHQIRGSVGAAYAFAKLLCDDLKGRDEERDARVLRGQIGKAKNVTETMQFLRGLFDRSESAILLPKRQESINSGDLQKLAFEIADNECILAEPVKGLNFHIDSKSFSEGPAVDLQVHRPFLEQVLYCLCDNAFKYANANSTIHLKASLKRTSGNFIITVSNQGIPIQQEELSRIFNQGFRGAAARAATGEGLGIGLWISKHMMKAMGGDLEITHDSSESRTDARVIIPTQ